MGITTKGRGRVSMAKHLTHGRNGHAATERQACRNGAEFEKSLIVERTKEGLALAVAQGKRLGRPPGSKDKKKRSRRGYLIPWSE